MALRSTFLGLGCLVVLGACATNELGLLPHDGPAPDAEIPDAPPPPPPDAAEIPDGTPPPDACVPNPAGEVCNGLDDDCDGTPDDGFPPVNQPCSVGMGECRRTGVTMCAPDGMSVICDAVPGEPAPIDLCENDLDDDCDGDIDEDFPDFGTLCFEGEGGCRRPGVMVCNDAKDALECDAVPGAPTTELCGTTVDEDCDGLIDEGFPQVGQPCTVGMGQCKANGIIVCNPNDRTMTMCGAVPGTPTSEMCNGLDDNCDGDPDDGDPGSGATCTTGNAGECGPGHRHCVAGQLACVPDTGPTMELCNGLDDDCDGIPDDGFFIGQPCDGPDVNEFCARGTIQCLNPFNTYCAGDDVTTPELCNNFDDDCDGLVDENWNFFEDPTHCGNCTTVCGGSHNTIDCNSGVCDPACDVGWQSCDGNLVNGCESLRDTGSSCPGSRNATISGDTGQAAVVRTGYGEIQYRVRIEERDDGFDNLHARFRLQNPTGVMMQLCVYCVSCGAGNSACASPAGDQSVYASADETPFFVDDSFDAIVEVRYISAERTACLPWTLTMYSESDPPNGALDLDCD